MRIVEERGNLGGAVVCALEDEIFAIASDGIVIRTKVDQIRASGRDTMGVRLMNIGADRSLVAVARAGDSGEEVVDEDEDGIDVVNDDMTGAEPVSEQDPGPNEG